MNHKNKESSKQNQADREIVLQNIKKHDEMAETYDTMHVEIYNPTEQLRVEKTVRKVISLIETGQNPPVILDFGAGTGNLTRHFLNSGARVVAADVSNHSLSQLARKIGPSGLLDTVLLNGEDLSSMDDDQFDVVATYSVLHHVPDYLAIIDEFVRVLKPGGIVYIDHEASPVYWELDGKYQQYLEELGGNFSINHLFELGIDWETGTNIKKILKRFLKKLFPRLRKKPAVTEAGDIHVFKHDHIEWEQIKAILNLNCEVIEEVDYLVCRELEEIPGVWEKWQRDCVDMRYIILRKQRTTDDKQK